MSTSKRGHSQSKRHKRNKTTEIEDGLAELAIDEARNASLLAEIETLVRKIKEGQRFSRFAIKKLPEDESWEQTRNELLDTAQRSPDTKFKVVVLGPSGVGKSSVLNALLDEGNLLPSSATGDACTAVPIEIHYNNDADRMDVRAEIQYVTEVEWRRVIEEAKAEAETDEDEYTDRGQSALKRINLVYPSLQDYELIEHSVNDIIATNISKELLGKCTTLRASNRIDFCRDFKQQIGSIKRPGFAAWPMIDHVRLYVRHPLLKQGLVLVDIPGMFETNQARVENAANYLQKCSAVLIMTHAARSNADATQESLASRALQQVQFDQRLDCVMYVCTKSDELDLEEALDELDVPEANPLQEQLKIAKQDKKVIEDECNALEQQLEEQQKIATDSGNDIPRWKYAQSKAAGDWDSFVPPSERLANGKFLKAEVSDESWDEDDVNEKIESLKQEKKTATSRCKKLRTQLIAKERRLQDHQADIQELEMLTKRAVFKARNDLVKEQQARRYISAVKKYERDSAKTVEDIVELADDGAMQSSDFSNVKEKVFCVSAMAYSRISKLKRYAIKEGTEAVKDDGKKATFLEDVQDTEIPALAHRLMHLTLIEQYRKLKSIHRRMDIVFKGLQSRLSPNIQHTDIDVEAAEQANRDFAGELSLFLEGFREFSAKDAVVKGIYKNKLSEVLPRIKIRTNKQAIKKLNLYAQHPGSGSNKKALWPGELKATVHESRCGFYVTKRLLNSGDALRVEINGDVAAVIMQHTHKSVRRSTCEARQTLMKYKQESETRMDKLNSEFRLKAMTVGVGLHNVNLIDEKLQLRKEELQQIYDDAAEEIGKSHVAAARLLEKDIANGLKPAYARAHVKLGPGARAAMSAELTEALEGDGVVENALKMFDRRTTARVSDTLVTLAGTLTAMANSIVADYTRHMEHRNRKIESTGDPKLDKVRNGLIALGYDDSQSLVVDAEEDVPVDVGAEAAELDELMAGLAEEVDKIDGTEVKVEAVSEEVGDETEDRESRGETEDGQIKDEAGEDEMTDEETDEDTN